MPGSSGVSETWDRRDLVFPFPHSIPIQLWGAFETWEADEGESSSLPGAIIDEESSLSEEESTRGEFSWLGMGLMVLSLLCEMNCDPEGVVTSSSGILFDKATSSERASDSDIERDCETRLSECQTSRSGGTDHVALTPLYLMDTLIIVRE